MTYTTGKLGLDRGSWMLTQEVNHVSAAVSIFIHPECKWSLTIDECPQLLHYTINIKGPCFCNNLLSRAIATWGGASPGALLLSLQLCWLGWTLRPLRTLFILYGMVAASSVAPSILLRAMFIIC